MEGFVKRINEQGMTRDDARKARATKQGRSQPFVFRHQSPGREYTFELKFRRSAVEKDELIKVLETILISLRESSGE